jgi:hypothetical protein
VTAVILKGFRLPTALTERRYRTFAEVPKYFTLTAREINRLIAYPRSFMKPLLLFFAAGWIFISSSAQGAETAHARLVCFSPRFAEGTDTYGDTLDLSTIGGPPFNGELLPYSGSTGASGFALEIYNGFTTIYGTIYVNLPLGTDADGDGFDDFFEVAQGVSATTSGNYSTELSSDNSITAIWSRAAGSKDGTCVIDLNDEVYGDLGDYTCPFELLEYTGPLTYTPGAGTVSAAINLTQTGNPANTLQGAVNFDKSAADQFNTLTNQPGVWTNAALQTLAFDSEIFSRDPTWPTNYYGYVYFSDGDPATDGADYQLWLLSIDDTNDADADGVPDFSDDPASVTPPRAPTLSLALGQTNVLLTISGDTGHTNLIQAATSLISADWQTASSLMLTNDPQTVSLPLPSQPTFWRVLAQ